MKREKGCDLQVTEPCFTEGKLPEEGDGLYPASLEFLKSARIFEKFRIFFSFKLQTSYSISANTITKIEVCGRVQMQIYKIHLLCLCDHGHLF